MTHLRNILVGLSCAGLLACATPADQADTLRQLESVPAEVDDIHVADSLERAADSYRRYLEETSESARTPEAMRRLADLQIEQAYGVMGSGDITELAAPDAATPTQQIVAKQSDNGTAPDQESDEEFEARASQREVLLAQSSDVDPLLPGDATVA